MTIIERAHTSGPIRSAQLVFDWDELVQEDRVNLNQGAESTLAFLLSLGEMKLVESTPAALRQAQVT